MQCVTERGVYVHGPEEAAFCAEFGAYLGMPHVIGCASGTAALILALKGLGIGKGALVATVSHTYRANVDAIRAVGAEPLYVDVYPEVMTMDVRELERALATFKVHAVLAVHLYGMPFDPAIATVCRARGLPLIEDCAQSHGLYTGHIGDAAAFSFYPTKNLACLGDGGAVAFKRDPPPRPDHGLDEIHAAVLRARLPLLDEHNTWRRAHARTYRAAPPPGHVYHQFVLRPTNRMHFRMHMHARGIATQVHYPVPVHVQYPGLMCGALPVTTYLARHVVSVPVHQYLTVDETARVRRALELYYE